MAKDQNKTIKSIYIDEKFHRQMKAFAAKHGMSVSRLIVVAITKYTGIKVDE